MSGITVGMLTDDEIREISARLTNASTRPWKVEAGFSGNDWLIASLGNSGEDGENYHIVTDHVHASEFEGDAKTDAEFIVWCRNDMAKIGRAYVALRSVAVDLYQAGIGALEILADAGLDTHEAYIELSDALKAARGEAAQ